MTKQEIANRKAIVEKLIAMLDPKNNVWKTYINKNKAGWSVKLMFGNMRWDSGYGRYFIYKSDYAIKEAELLAQQALGNFPGFVRAKIGFVKEAGFEDAFIFTTVYLNGELSVDPTYALTDEAMEAEDDKLNNVDLLKKVKADLKKIHVIEIKID